ncbi:MAG: multicopper oxidase domain-containing protein [Thermoleophilia bacterium]
MPSASCGGRRWSRWRLPRPMFSPKLNTVEEWLLVNNSPEWHNFHIHIDPYQVVARNGKPVKGQPEWADSIAMPPNSRITIRQRFADFTGRFVFHCHVLVHEDHGMMAEVMVVR